MAKAQKLFFLIAFTSSLLLGFQSETEVYVGSKNSDKYHKQTCEWAQKISKTNLVKFKDADEAEAAGYVPCKVCKPPKAGTAVERRTSSSEKKIYSAPTESKQCAAKTKKGTRCLRKARAGSAYCWQHGG